MPLHVALEIEPLRQLSSAGGACDEFARVLRLDVLVEVPLVALLEGLGTVRTRQELIVVGLDKTNLIFQPFSERPTPLLPQRKLPST